MAIYYGLRRTTTAQTQSRREGDKTRTEPMLSRGGTDREGRPTGKIVGTKEGNPEKGF